MKNHIQNCRKNLFKIAFVFGLIPSIVGCAQKPILKQLDNRAPETAINSPAQADALKKMHNK